MVTRGVFPLPPSSLALANNPYARRRPGFAFVGCYNHPVLLLLLDLSPPLSLCEEGVFSVKVYTGSTAIRLCVCIFFSSPTVVYRLDGVLSHV